MARVIELFDSRATTGGSPPREALFKYAILECQDEEQAEGLLYAEAPDEYRNLVIDNEKVKIEKAGHDWYTAEVPYIFPPIPDFPGGGGEDEDDPTAGLFEFDATGGTQHITQCISQIEYGPDAAPNIAAARVVNLTRDGVEGVDQEIPGLTFSVTKRFLVADVDPFYINNLSRMKGKMNRLPYSVGGSEYDPGELLFMGAAGRKATIDGERKWEIAFRFAANQNRANIAITPLINVPMKRGWDYLWVQYHKDVADNEFVEVPLRAWVSRIYEEESFAAVLGF